MSTPARTNIVLDIKAKLEAITVANGYHTTVVLVEPYLRSRDEVPVGSRPYLCFGFDKEPIESTLSGVFDVSPELIVMGHLTGDDWTTKSAALNNLIDDVLAALSADPTRDANAYDTLPLECASDEFDPDAEQSGSVYLKFRIKYERTRALT